MAERRHSDDHTDEQGVGKALKRRGLIAGAAALVAGLVATRTSQPVAAAQAQYDSYIAWSGGSAAYLAGEGTNYVYGVQAYGNTTGVYGLGGDFTDGTGVRGDGQGKGAGVYGQGGGTSGFGMQGLGGLPDGTGVRGTGAGNGAGVYGMGGAGGTGVIGQGVNGPGVYGTTNGNASSKGVYGSHPINGYGVYGDAGTGGYGVTGVSPNAIGVLGQSPTGTGVQGTSGGNATSKAVYGHHTAGGYGVFGDAGAGGYGVTGVGTTSYGVVGASTSGAGIYGGSTSGQYGVVGSSGTAPGGAGLLGVANGANAVGFGTIVQNGATFAGYFNGTTVVDGAFAVTGSKSAAVPHSDGTMRLVYSVESPENWFEDFGEAKLVGGKAEVKIDADFADIVHTDSYHIFLTAYGNTNGLHVTKRTPTGFGVAEHNGGANSLGFSYRIVARRKDIKAERLAKFTMPPKLVAPKAPAPPPPPLAPDRKA